MQNPCPSHAELHSYAVGLMSDVQAAVLEEHLGECETCEQTLAGIDDTTDPLVGKLRTLDTVTVAPQDLSGLIGKLDRLHAESESRVGNEHEGLEQIHRYAILRKIGSGGNGVVYEARHLDLNRIVALKLLTPERLSNATAIARFEREMRAVGQLNHPNVVQALDAGQFLGQPYLVMEYVEGVVVSQLVAANDKLNVADACEIIRQAALGLAAAHNDGIIHRDVKPSNLIVTRDGCVKLLDLGLARAERPLGEEDLTGEDRVVGTANYVAPEQALQNVRVDRRVDLYSSGATLFKLLSGHPPFTGNEYDTPLKKVLGHARDLPPDLRITHPELPEGLVQIVERLLAKAPDERFSTAEELAAAVAPFCEGADLQTLVQNVEASASLNGTGSSALEAADETAKSFTALTPLDGINLQPYLQQAEAAPARKTPFATLIALMTVAVGIVLLAIVIPKLIDPRTESVADKRVFDDRDSNKNVANDFQPSAAIFGGLDEEHILKPFRQEVTHANVGVDSLAIHPSGKFFAAACESPSLDRPSVIFWTMSPWGTVMEVAPAEDPITSIDFFQQEGEENLLVIQISRDRRRGDVLVDEMVGSALVCTLPATDRFGKDRATFEDAYEDVRDAAVSPDGSGMAAIGYSSHLRIHDLNQRGGIIKHFRELSGSKVIYSPNGKWLALVDQQGEVELIDTSDWSTRHLSSQAGKVHDVTFDPDSQFLAGCGGMEGDAFATTWDIESGVEGEITRYDGPRPEQVVCFGTDNKVIGVRSQENVLRLWRIKDQQELRTAGDVERPIDAAVVTPSGDTIVIARSNGNLEFYHVD